MLRLFTILIAVFALSSVAPAADATVKFTGKLVPDAKSPVAKAVGKTYRLTPTDDYTRHILHDSRLAGREMHFEGRWKDSSTFEVRKALTVRDGRLYKVIWFCDTCQITSYRPGRCDCCQEDTAVREIPYDPHNSIQ